jgi:N-acetyl-anhydromuramyl-L-alanine amidase AmpD
MVKIQKKITPYNFSHMNYKKNEYIVIHYVGAVSTAKNNADYYARTKLNASANYFVDENEIWQSVEDYNRAWHCGGGLQGKYGHTFHNICTNSNSIGIEMCVKKDKAGNWYFEENTVKNTIDLVKMLMQKYNIPIDRVIRHYDVTGKNCPAPYVNETEWKKFKDRILTDEGDLTMAQYEELKKEIAELKKIVETIAKSTEIVYNKIDDVPEWGKPTIQKLIDKGLYKGASESNLNLSESLLRTLVINDRAGLYD